MSTTSSAIGTGEPPELIRRWIGMADARVESDFGAFSTDDDPGHLSGRIHMDVPKLQRLERGVAAAFGEVTRTIGDLWGAASCCSSRGGRRIVRSSTALPRPAVRSSSRGW
jgi:hypothetical protein